MRVIIIGGWRLEVGGWGLIGGWRLEVGGWGLIGDWRLEIGVSRGRGLEVGGWALSGGSRVGVGGWLAREGGAAGVGSALRRASQNERQMDSVLGGRRSARVRRSVAGSGHRGRYLGRGDPGGGPRRAPTHAAPGPAQSAGAPAAAYAHADLAGCEHDRRLATRCGPECRAATRAHHRAADAAAAAATAPNEVSTAHRRFLSCGGIVPPGGAAARSATSECPNL
jgi:hypothetical protein